jgi:uncharacterized membrane protein
MPQPSSSPSPHHTKSNDIPVLELPILYRDSKNHLHKVEDDIDRYFENELDVSRLSEIHKHLWLAGLSIPARPLHRQVMMGRDVIVVEQADLHLTWIGRRIFVKPLPAFLLSHLHWTKHICLSKELHSRAMGLLLSYIWLVCQPSDLKVAIDCGLLPSNMTWQQWMNLVGELVPKIDMRGLSNVNKRYEHGELRLGRLNKIYRFAPELKLKHLMRGYRSQDTVYGTFFEREFAWLLILFVYISIMLTAAQLGLATDRLQPSLAFQRISFGLTMLFIFLPVVFIVLIIIWFFVLFFYNLTTTLSFEESRTKGRRNTKGQKLDASV